MARVQQAIVISAVCLAPLFAAAEEEPPAAGFNPFAPDPSSSQAAEPPSSTPPEGREGREERPRGWRHSASGSFEVNPFELLPIPEREMDEVERRQLSEQLATEGTADLEAYRFEEAARKLEASYWLSGDHEVLRPLADALRQMGSFAAAAERLQRYLDEAEGLDTATAMELERQVLELRRQYARVSVNSRPEGATVFLGDHRLGVTPHIAPFLLNHGNYQLQAHLEGHRDEVIELAVAGGRAVELLIEFEPLEDGDGRGDRGRRGLGIGLWTTTGLAAASAVMMVVALVMAGHQHADLTESWSPAVADSDRALGWAYAGYGLIGATAATGTAAITLGIIYGIQRRGEDRRGEP